MKRCFALSTAVSLALALVAWVSEASAGSGDTFRSGGRAAREDERSSRGPSGGGLSWSSPPSDAPPVEPPRKPMSWRRMMRGLLTGGLIGSIFFGKSLGGVGLLEVVILSGLIVLAFWALSRHQPGLGGGRYAMAGAPAGSAPSGLPTGGGVTVEDPRDALERGLDDIRHADPSFDFARFALTVGDIFRRVQAAWTARDIARAAEVLTPAMRERLERQTARLRTAGRINRVEGITIRRVAVTEARRERGWDRVTVHIVAGLVDYTTDEVGLKVLEGNPFEPVSFSEHWQLVRPSGPHPWRLDAIE